MDPPRTPDGRYIIHEGRAGPRLWRASNPDLSDQERFALVTELMDARRAVRAAKDDPDLLAVARAKVDLAKRRLGERGPVWWSDGSDDHNRALVRNSPYALWWEVERERQQTPE